MILCPTIWYGTGHGTNVRRYDLVAASPIFSNGGGFARFKASNLEKLAAVERRGAIFKTFSLFFNIYELEPSVRSVFRVWPTRPTVLCCSLYAVIAVVTVWHSLCSY